MFLVLVTESSNECGHSVCEFDTLQEAQEYMVEGKKDFSEGVYSAGAEVQLFVLLDEDEWSRSSKH